MCNNLRRLIKMAGYLCLFTALTACSSSPWTLFPTKINAQVLASFEVNPDANNRPSPLVIRIYELKSISAFNDADFFKLYDEEEATLGGDLLSREEFEISPGKGHEIIRTAHEQARFFAVIAAYRNIDKARWRDSTVIILNSTNSMVVKIGKQNISINRR